MANVARQTRAAPWLALSLVTALAQGACDPPKDSPGPSTGKLPLPGREPRPVDKALISRALAALEPKLPAEAAFLEIRVRPALVELQLISDQTVTSLRYRETPATNGAQLEGPVGKVDPPVQVPVYGKGDLAKNGFTAKEVDLQGIATSFTVALKAVDPADGWVRELVVRRYFPFGNAVRARIFVESPRMSGSIDTNGNGIPLRPGQ